MRQSVLAGSLAFVMLGAQAQQQAPQDNVAQQSIPDAPKPQPTLPNLGNITPGKGASDSNSSTPDAGTPGATLPGTPGGTVVAQSPPPDGPPDTNVDVPVDGKGADAVYKLSVNVNFVQIPFTVKDSKGQLVPGLLPRDVRIFENGLRQQMVLFTTDPFPLSVAFVIDQSLPNTVMPTINNALGAVQGAFTPYDEIAVFTYNNGPHMVTDFTGAQSARLAQAIEQSKSTGRDALMAGSLSGPMAQTTVINDQQFDPNTAANRGHTGMQLNPPKEVHTLNDAILAAAVSLSKAAPGRRRVIYVVSDGKEYGSVAKPKQVIKYLQTNKIGVYGTLVGDSAVDGLGFLDRIHLPLMMRDNVLPIYAGATGGEFDAELRTNGIEKSFSKIAEQVRTQYTAGYYSHESMLDEKYRKVTVVVERPKLTVIAKDGYYPSVMDAKPKVMSTQAK